jgi:hypothetical protein
MNPPTLKSNQHGQERAQTFLTNKERGKTKETKNHSSYKRISYRALPEQTLYLTFE